MEAINLTEAQLRILKACDGNIGVIVNAVSRRPMQTLRRLGLVTITSKRVPGDYPSSHGRDLITARITLDGQRALMALRRLRR